MKNLKQIQNKVVLYKDFKKVVNIQKILVMQQVAKWRGIAEQVKFRSVVFNNILVDLDAHNRIFDPNYFGKGRVLIPRERDLHIVVSNPNSDKITEYVDKLLVDHIKSSHSPEDVYVVVGKGLFDLFVRNGLTVVKSFLEDGIVNANNLYERLAHIVTQGFDNMLFHRASFLYFDIISKKVVDTTFFPFSQEKADITPQLRSSVGEDVLSLLSDKRFKTTFYRDVASVGDGIANLAIKNRVYSAIVDYKVALFLRELQILDDKERNINEEIARLILLKQRIRKENITNELIVTSTAFRFLKLKWAAEDEKKTRSASREGK